MGDAEKDFPPITGMWREPAQQAVNSEGVVEPSEYDVYTANLQTRRAEHGLPAQASEQKLPPKNEYLRSGERILDETSVELYNQLKQALFNNKDFQRAEADRLLMYPRSQERGIHAYTEWTMSSFRVGDYVVEVDQKSAWPNLDISVGLFDESDFEAALDHASRWAIGYPNIPKDLNQALPVVVGSDKLVEEMSLVLKSIPTNGATPKESGFSYLGPNVYSTNAEGTVNQGTKKAQKNTFAAKDAILDFMQRLSNGDLSIKAPEEPSSVIDITPTMTSSARTETPTSTEAPNYPTNQIPTTPPEIQ